jgi:hypothetical protein
MGMQVYGHIRRQIEDNRKRNTSRGMKIRQEHYREKKFIIHSQHDRKKTCHDKQRTGNSLKFQRDTTGNTDA